MAVSSLEHNPVHCIPMFSNTALYVVIDILYFIHYLWDDRHHVSASCALEDPHGGQVRRKMPPQPSPGISVVHWVTSGPAMERLWDGKALYTRRWK